MRRSWCSRSFLPGYRADDATRIHPHTSHAGESPQKVLVEIGVVRAHHDSNYGIRK
jgi:hypothetical protein